MHVSRYLTLRNVVVLHSGVTMLPVTAERKVVLKQESNCGVAEWHKNGCVDGCRHAKALTRDCECDENAQR